MPRAMWPMLKVLPLSFELSDGYPVDLYGYPVVVANGPIGLYGCG